MRMFEPLRSKPSFQAAGRLAPGISAIVRQAPFSKVAGMTFDVALSISISSGRSKLVTLPPLSAQYAVTFRTSLADWKPPETPVAGCGSRRRTSQSLAGAPDQAPAGTVTVVVSLDERRDMDVEGMEFFSMKG
jgi:hypothetical protein